MGKKMGKRKKHKIKDLEDDKFFELESSAQDDLEFFEKFLDETDWNQVSKEIEKKGKALTTEKGNKRKSLVKTLDLHGYTLEEAKEFLDQFIEREILLKGDKLTLRIITGKGLRSGPSGGVLAREIPLHVERKWAKRVLYMEESPAKLILGEIPIRGDFTVILNVR